MRTTIKILLAPLALSFAIAAAPASAAHSVSCGDTVREDLTLKKDLDCSAGGTGGLVVGKDGITIDLAGHTIIGAGATDGYEGIENEGHDGVVIKNGGIRAFKDGIFLSNVAKNEVTNLSLRAGIAGTTTGVNSSYGTGNEFVHNRLFSPNYGFQLSDGSQNTVRDNRIVEANRGVFTTNEAFDRIEDNVSEGFSIATYAFYSQNDYRTSYVGDTADGGYEGFYINIPRGVTLKRVQANDNGSAGIYVDGPATCATCSAEITRSEASGNGEYGIYGAFPLRSRHNSAMGNRYYNCHLAACNGRVSGR
jgi:hypothetical protein